jgi:two-component system, response regulator PdtaR
LLFLGSSGGPQRNGGDGREPLPIDAWSRFTAIILDRRLPGTTAEKLMPRLKAAAPGAALIVITDIRMPDMDGSDAATQIYRQAAIPVILVSAYHDAGVIRQAEADHIMAYLVKPIKQADLEPAISIAMRRFEQFQELRKETSDLKQALEDRKIIEKAKGIVMKKAGMDEHDAFRRLQRLPSDKNRKLIEIAQMILTAEEALEPPGRFQ